jgi:hypothetical protein
MTQPTTPAFVSQGIAFAKPETERYPHAETTGVDEFQRTMWALDCWPLDDAFPITAWDVRLLTARAADETNTAYLTRLARF